MGKVERIVFLSLVLDLFAFTIPLPLFPRIIEWYTVREISDPNGLLSRTLRFVSAVRGIFYKPLQNSQRWDVVFLGGLMGSAFSICSTLQFLVSPHIGSLSDTYGRRNVLLITMIGNILSALVWIQSTTFASYMLSRIIGGLSEGNVQLATAILSDISTPRNRSKALAHVGIAFAICFCIGPPIGAYFASRPVPLFVGALQMELNVYAVPALLTLVLLIAETLFLTVALPETRNTQPDKPAVHVNEKSNAAPAVRSVQERTEILRVLRKLHFLFLGIFSGVEFTLTFLTFDLFDWNNKQNGALIGSIGIISALLQGGYVRRVISKVGEGKMAQRGVSSCALGLVFLTILPHFVSTQPKIAVGLLRAAAVCLAFTSATVVSSLTAHASLQCDEGFDKDTGKPAAVYPELAKGKALGEFRSSGQLGRAIGPLLACASYWTFGPSVTYGVSAIAMLTLSASMKTVAVLPGKSS
ncbi:major facilitator superfamily domain-containing protein [Suillus fuscotomentosus]|uniref:Major facilitator superfamily domain-containing protein n=1 Tax=Suillus fuscotomentosus TaxID=1912939 RepID=A0AAD4HTS7_9AGAM|nr:major facilitator superfamily domain-containing protein [Suillus fuscotomentosus]KAG1907079.1 major facilitator superfamily domain-containing protein [Suillus fuscotomentosus]